MKKRIASILAAIALFATAGASLGCIWLWHDEPNSCGIFND